MYGYYQDGTDVNGKPIYKSRTAEMAAITDPNATGYTPAVTFISGMDVRKTAPYAQPVLNLISCTRIGRVFGGGYGEGSYGRRGYDAKYRGHEHLDRMYDNYGRYEEGRSRYGANEDTKKSLEYMLRSMEDFARMLKEEAQSQEEVNMIKQTAQRIAQM